MGGGAGVVMMAEADGFGLEGCDLLLLKHLTDELMHLARHLLSGQELEEERLLDHSEDFDLLRLMRLSSVYNVVTSPDLMKIEDGKSPHVHRALPTRTLDMSRSKVDCDSETDVVRLRIDSEKDGPNDNDTNAHGHCHGCFSIPVLIVVVVARVLFFVVNLFFNKMGREGGSGDVEMKVVSDDLTSLRAFRCVDSIIAMSRNKNRTKTKKRSG